MGHALGGMQGCMSFLSCRLVSPLITPMMLSDAVILRISKCTYLCVHCVWICLHIYIYISACIYIYIYTYRCACVHTFIRMC